MVNVSFTEMPFEPEWLLIVSTKCSFDFCVNQIVHFHVSTSCQTEIERQSRKLSSADFWMLFAQFYIFAIEASFRSMAVQVVIKTQFLCILEKQDFTVIIVNIALIIESWHLYKYLCTAPQL